MKLRYLHLDVFTDTPFEGNQLAVFPEPPPEIEPALMQRIAAEMNFSESTFVFPKEGKGDVRMRIFTPSEELPMAGHPTIGSTFALAAEGIIPPGRTDFVFELGVGPTPVSLEWKDGALPPQRAQNARRGPRLPPQRAQNARRGPRLDFAWMTQPLPSFEAELDAGTLAASLGLEGLDTVPELPAQVISCGVPFLFVALKSRNAVDRVEVDRRAYDAACRRTGIGQVPVFIFTTDRGGAAGDETVYSRMLAPGFGIAEDPATGGASGPLGCYLVHHDVLDSDQVRSFVSLQGAAMRRPSRLYISIDTHDKTITRVRVGGRSVMVGSGELTFQVP